MGYPELRQALRNIPNSLNDRDFFFLPGWGSRLILGFPTAVLLSLKTPALGYLLQLYRLNSKPAPGRHSPPRPRVEHVVDHNIRMHPKPLLTYHQRSELVPWRGQLCLQPPSLLRCGVTLGGMQGYAITEIIIRKKIWNVACLMNSQKQHEATRASSCMNSQHTKNSRGVWNGAGPSHSILLRPEMY